MLFIDVLTFKPGKSGAEASAYFAKAAPILARHGLRRQSAYEVTGKMRGHAEVSPSLVQIWEAPGPEAFQAMGADEAYKAITPLRDSIFDMSALQGWFAEKVA